MFYPGLHQAGDAQHFARCMISVNRLMTRRAPVRCRHVAVDSGAFTKVFKYGGYPDPPEVYAGHVNRLAGVIEGIDFASSEDLMCEPFILAKTGLGVADHQRITIERYDALRSLISSAVYVLPVLQGYAPNEYLAHLAQYGDRLPPGAWVGVGSVCKRNGNVSALESVLMAIKETRPDLRLHGFGVKTTGLESTVVRDCLHSADSMAWSTAARKARHAGDMTRSANNWREAAAFVVKVERQMGRRQRHFQTSMWSGL